MKQLCRFLILALVVGYLGGCGDEDNPASSGMVTITVENNLDNPLTDDTWDIYLIFFSPAASKTWGDDRLGSAESLTYGSSRSFDVIGGEYDIKAVDADGDCYYLLGKTINSNYTWSVDLLSYDDTCSAGKLATQD